MVILFHGPWLNDGGFVCLRGEPFKILTQRPFGKQRLYDIVEICAADTAFAALCADGRAPGRGHPQTLHPKGGYRAAR